MGGGGAYLECQSKLVAVLLPPSYGATPPGCAAASVVERAEECTRLLHIKGVAFSLFHQPQALPPVPHAQRGASVEWTQGQGGRWLDDYSSIEFLLQVKSWFCLLSFSSVLVPALERGRIMLTVPFLAGSC
jgi:hypothetical protein